VNSPRQINVPLLDRNSVQIHTAKEVKKPGSFLKKTGFLKAHSSGLGVFLKPGLLNPDCEALGSTPSRVAIK